MRTSVEKSPSFETSRLMVASLSPFEALNVLAVILEEEERASPAQCPAEKSGGSALREAFGSKLQIARGQTRVWGIVVREQRMLIGAIIVRSSHEGINVEVVIPSQFWDDKIADEAAEPVLEWLANDLEIAKEIPAHLH